MNNTKALLENTWKYLKEISDKEVQFLLAKFKEEVKDYDLEITDKQLETYIKRFDQLKNNPNIKEKDLRKYNVRQFLRIVTKYDTKDPSDEFAPEAVYTSPDGDITLINGQNEATCKRHPNRTDSKRWCITVSSFASYRYNEARGFPSFYIAKNTNLPESNPKSMVAIQVRNNTYPDNKRYVLTGRDNDPYEIPNLSFEDLITRVPWLNEIPDVEEKLKYLPLTSSEVVLQKFQGNAVPYTAWNTLPVSAKKQYLVSRSNSNELFRGITPGEFLASGNLKKHPEISNFVAKTNSVFNNLVLLRNLDKFSSSEQGSILANMRDLSSDILLDTQISFEVKKILLDKDRIKQGEMPQPTSYKAYSYVTSTGDLIALVVVDKDKPKVELTIVEDEDVYRNVRISKNTVKYITDNEEMYKVIPLGMYLQWAKQNMLPPQASKQVVELAKSENQPNITYIRSGDDELIVDFTTLSAYKIEKGGLQSTEFQQAIAAAGDKGEEIAKNFLTKVFKKQRDELPPQIPAEEVILLINSIPIADRLAGLNVVLVSTDSRIVAIKIPADLYKPEASICYSKATNGSWVRASYGNADLTESDYVAYGEFLQASGITFEAEEFISVLKRAEDGSSKRDFLLYMHPYLDPNSAFKYLDQQGTLKLVNTLDPRSSIVYNDRTGKLNKFVARPAEIRAVTVVEPQAEPEAEPEQQAQGEPEAQPQQQAQGDNDSLETMLADESIATEFSTLPQRIKDIFADGVEVFAHGAWLRKIQNALGDRGQTTELYRAIGNSSNNITVITKQDGGKAAVAVTTVGGRKLWALEGGTAWQLGRATELTNYLENL